MIAHDTDRPLRRDAAENRERVLAAAVAMFAREGRDISMAAIAEAAGVGVGTLYRRYPTRERLLEALTERSFELVLAAIDRANQGNNPGIAKLEAFYDATIAHRRELVLPMHGGPQHVSAAAQHTRRRIWEIADAILEQGRHDRTIRGDVTAADVIGFGALLAHTLSPDSSWVAVLHRQKQIYLAGLAPRGAALKELPT
ncbi:TetR/AcrR family transcriptional regulator [Mycobacterium sp. NPDC048908]|uniref:TetR/AcrR family transcriptional regulator n=1 Tax=Mycobacterium sp. NPDC048908 TaxID=3364292 RepID=UPI00371AECCB